MQTFLCPWLGATVQRFDEVGPLFDPATDLFVGAATGRFHEYIPFHGAAGEVHFRIGVSRPHGKWRHDPYPSFGFDCLQNSKEKLDGNWPRDFEARSTLVEMLNDHAAIKVAGLRALEYDRPDLHNPCLVVVVKGQGKSAAELLTSWLAGEIEEAPLPDELELEISELVAEAYEI